MPTFSGTRLIFRQRKSTKNHRILPKNSRTPPKTKYAFKLSLTEAAYTKLQKIYEKKIMLQK